MSGGSSVGASRRVQEHILHRDIAPARRKRQNTVRVLAGDVVRALGLWTRVPQVCSAMQSQRFLRAQGLEVVARQGPPSGQSTTLQLTYQIQDGGGGSEDLMRSLYGRLRDAYAAEGGGEAFHRREKASFERRRRP
ncbi:MAG TPA: hypothetical protein VFP94_04155 [Terriglobales bacterium]|nr:hypothetical protein [Terriglobales bacterium]